MGETINQAWLRQMRDGLRNFFPVNPAEMYKHEVIGLAWRLRGGVRGLPGAPGQGPALRPVG